MKEKKNCGKAFFCCFLDWEILLWFPVWVWCFHLSDNSKVLFRKIYAQICLSWCSFKFFFTFALYFSLFFQYSIMFISNCNEIFFVCFVLFGLLSAYNQYIVFVSVCVFFKTKRCIPRKVDSLAPQKESLPSSSRLRQIWLDSLSFIINIK